MGEKTYPDIKSAAVELRLACEGFRRAARNQLALTDRELGRLDEVSKTDKKLAVDVAITRSIEIVRIALNAVGSQTPESWAMQDAMKFMALAQKLSK